jgi:hypothetical protein
METLAEKRELQASIDQLRRSLEQNQADHRAELQRQEAQVRIQLGELQQALMAQRQLLETSAEGARP